jgi:ribosomal protein L12E/L44/L45/RPP1/RPP2
MTRGLQVARVALRSRWTLLIAATMAVAASASSGASAQQRVAVGAIEGRGAAAVRAAALRALKERDEVEVVGGNEISKISDQLGVDVVDGRMPISGELQIGAWLEGSVEREGKRVAITMNVLDGSGQALGVMSYSAKNPKLLARRIEDSLWKDLGDLIMQGQPPVRVEPEPVAAAEPEAELDAEEQQPAEEEEEDEDDTAQESDDGGGQDLPSALDVGLSFAGFSRSFDYNDDLSGLRSYDLGLGPTVMLKLRWYPVAHFDDGFAANIGLELRGQFAFGLDSALDDTSFPTSSRAFGAGLRARLPIDDHELAAVVGYASQTFSIDAAEDAGVEIDPGVPSTSYGYLRLGAELRFALGESFALGAGAAFLPTFSTGEIENWFPRASATGIEGELMLSHSLSQALELSAAFGIQRFAFSFNPETTDVAEDRPIAGGAVDQYLWATLGVRWVLGK